jgi:hypothetical protein
MIVHQGAVIMKKIVFHSFIVVALLGVLGPEGLRADSAPKPTTLAAVDIKPTSATLKGKIDPGGLRTDFYFISCDPTSSASFFLQTPAKYTDGTTVKAVSQELTGLKPGMTYHYALTASNSKGKVTASCLAFTTASAPPPPQGSAPTVMTLAATEVTSTSAVLNATVNPNGLAVKVSFKSCSAPSDPSYFFLTSKKDLAAGSTPQSVGFRLSGLTPGLTYRYAIRASSSAGNKVGDCLSFTTPGQAGTGKPVVTTMPPINVGATSVTLCGMVNPKGLATTYSFASGGADAHDPDYFPVTAKKDAGSSNSSLNVTTNISGLFPNLPYKYKIQAKNSAGEVVGAYVSFTTARASGPPSVETLPPIGILGTRAYLQGLLNSNDGTGTTYSFISCDGVNAPSYFAPTPPRSPEATTSSRVVSVEINNLKPKTTYRYALKATNSQGSNTGKCVTFTTLAAQAAPPTVMTSPAKSVASTSVWLEGYVNPNGVATTAWFDTCATSASAADYFPPTPEQSIGDGIEQKKVSAFVSSLFPGQTYRFHVWAQNSIGRLVGECLVFTTTGQQGIILQTQPAQSVTSSSALLCAKVNPNGINTTVGFTCTAPASGCFESVPNQNIGYLKGTKTVLQIVLDLKPSTAYCYYARNWGPDGVEVRGTAVCFTTLASNATGLPTAITQAAQNIASNGAELRAIISPNGLPTTFYFESCVPFPSTPSFLSTRVTDCGSSGSNLTRLGGLAGLSPDTTYQYRVVATNSKGTVKGECMTFKTSSRPPDMLSGSGMSAEGKIPDRPE